jgi:hypothetical protein
MDNIQDQIDQTQMNELDEIFRDTQGVDELAEFYNAAAEKSAWMDALESGVAGI